MLFNSYEFILVFVPITWCVYQFLRTVPSTVPGTIWLCIASLTFYGYWNISYIWLLLTSVAVNFILSGMIAATPPADHRRGRMLLTMGVAFNLLLLGYFKYTNFFIDNLNLFLGSKINIEFIILPIGISFFTFQQIAFLVDVYRREVVERNLSKYILFVSFFPQLIAGPIVHHREMMPQFGKQARSDILPDAAVGLTIFAIGLFKKVVIADTVAVPSSIVFGAAAYGVTPTFAEAWLGAFSYAFQIYFDFSGYSDMAIGVARMFGIRLPMNFASPYKATSVIDFWRRWHITLSRFLRDYLYIPLGGNRRGPIHRYSNVFVTMVLGGIWHGAGWTFLLWGALHGFFILVNQMWRKYATRRRGGAESRAQPPAIVGRICTFLLVVIAWVPFRAEDLDTTFRMYSGMASLGVVMFTSLSNIVGLGQISSISSLGFGHNGLQINTELLSISLAFLLWAVWRLPNTQEIMRITRPTLPTEGYPATDLDALPKDRPQWSGQLKWGFITGFLLLICLSKLNDVSEFIYFQF